MDAIVHKHELFILGRRGGARANFAYHDLSEMILSKRNLSDANFTGASLHKAELQDVKLDRAILFCADLRHANLTGASLLRADLRGAAVRGANLTGANMTGVDLREGSLASAGGDGELTAAHGDLTVADKGGANLSGANLSNSRLSGAVAVGSNFSYATLKSSKFNNASLQNANFAGADLEGADMSDCDFSGVNLRGAVLVNTAINLSEVAPEAREGALTHMSAGLSLTDVAVLFSLDGINDHWILPTEGYMIVDITANKTREQGWYIAEGTRLYAKEFSGPPTQGGVYVSTFYGSENGQ